jgi:hypothetical protein
MTKEQMEQVWSRPGVLYPCEIILWGRGGEPGRRVTIRELRAQARKPAAYDVRSRAFQEIETGRKN